MPDILITDNLHDIISSIELIEKRFKDITGRPQDLLDIAALKEALNDQSDPIRAKH